MYFWISFHLDWQIDKDIFNWPIMAHTQILVEDTVFATSGELINETTMLEQSDWWGESMLSHLGLDQTKLNKLTYFQGENKFGSPPCVFPLVSLVHSVTVSVLSNTQHSQPDKHGVCSENWEYSALHFDYQMWHNLIKSNNNFVCNVTVCEFLL